jgi:hypothetical protein
LEGNPGRAPEIGVFVTPANAGIHVFLGAEDVDGLDIGEPSGLALGKPKGELRDAVLRTAKPGHDECGV